MEITYEEMVRKLAKPGQDIIATLTPESAHLLHMTIGITGEAGELLEAVINKDFENIKEELGDIEFYMEGLRQGLGTDVNEPMKAEYRESYTIVGEGDDDIQAEYAAAALLVNATRLLDAVKKHVIYNKELNIKDVMTALNGIESNAEIVRAHFGISVDDAINHNTDKLYTGAKARYKRGYTDEAAQVRADKQ